MKKIILFMFFVLMNSFAMNEYPNDFANQYQKTDRYDDEEIHLGLPSWVNLREDERIYSTADIFDKKNNIFKKVLNLPETHYINYQGEEYKAITYWSNGRIELGFSDDNYTRGPMIHAIGLDRSYVNPLDSSYNPLENFYWATRSELKKIGTKELYTDYYTLITFKVNESRSVQVLIYNDGEIQVQSWDNSTSPSVKLSRINSPFIDNGTYSRGLYEDVTILSMPLYDIKGLRPGWIAKSLRDGYDVNITEPVLGDGLVVTVKGADKDLGGIIAYDFSREHPIMGGISSVSVKYEMDETAKDPYYCWYFTEPDEFGVHQSHYNKRMEFGQNSLNLSVNDYEYSWENAFKFTKEDYKNIDTVQAYAFKFQRGSNLTTTEDHKYSFKIKEIIYNLKQSPSVQFLPIKNTYTLTIPNSIGGRVKVGNYTGIDDQYRTQKEYKFWLPENVPISIIPSVGYEVDQVYYYQLSGGAKRIDLYNSNDIELRKKGQMDFNLYVNTNTVFHVTFKECTLRELDPVTPAMVKTESFYDGTETSNRVGESAVFVDGFGSAVQKQQKVKDNYFSVSTNYTNASNQVIKTPLSFVTTNTDFSFVEMFCENCIAKANAYYDGTDEYDRPDAMNFAYSANEYYDGEKGLISASAGIAENSFENSQSNYSKNWVMPASSELDFVRLYLLDDVLLENVYKERSKTTENAFVLSISKDSRGRYSQKIMNDMGQLVSSWFYDLNNELITLYEYDEYGKMIKSYLKDYEELATTYEYNELGKLESSTNNDRGTVKSYYDSYGRTRLVKTPNHAAKGQNYYFANNYDFLGRLESTAEVLDYDFNKNYDQAIPEANLRYITKNIYGKPTLQLFTSLGLSEVIYNKTVKDKMEWVRSSDLGAVIAFDEYGNFTTLKISNFDRLGKKTHQWIIYGLSGSPAIQLTYEYTTADEIKTTTFSDWNGSDWVLKSTRFRTYDNDGRLLETSEDKLGVLASYTYTNNGNVKTKTYYDKGQEVFTKTIHQDVYGRVTNMTYTNKAGDNIYSTNLDYSKPTVTQASTISHNWKTLKNHGSISKTNKIEYDYVDRLKKVSHPEFYDDYGNQVPEQVIGVYNFDEIGRMKSKKESGEDNVNIEYNYETDTYRPSEFEITTVNKSGNVSVEKSNFFLYDPSGNIWYDKFNNVVYKLNELGLPVKMYKYPVMPNDITLEKVNSDDVPNGYTMKIDFAYDESGTRIWYSVDNRETGMSYTQLTIPNVGVYTSSGDDPVFKLKRMDLVAGGYRIEENSQDFAMFPVTDIQGNIRGYARKDAFVSAYDYLPYGTAIDMVVDGSNEDNKRWQGKEFDGEHGKYYFGARYFDPFFGMWMSPDPAGQFANPYTYGGDPINFIDPNGEIAVSTAIIVGAIVGAAIGGGTAAYNCADQGGSCTKAVSTGVTVGALAGAAGGGAGYAASGLAYGVANNAIFTSFVAGGAQSATSYVGNGLIGGQDMSFDGFMASTMFGAYSSAIGSAAGYNLPGAYASLVSGFTSNIAESLFQGETDVSNLLLSGAYGAGLSFASGFLNVLLTDPSELYMEMDYYGTKGDEGMYNAMKKIKEKAGRYLIGIHGDPTEAVAYPEAFKEDGKVKRRGPAYDAQMLYDAVKNDPDFIKATEVEMLICYAAKNKNGRNLAREFAQISGKPLIASTRIVHIAPWFGFYWSFGWKYYNYHNSPNSASTAASASSNSGY